MSTPIRIKRSAVPGKVPTTSDLQLGELAINTYDGRAFLKKDNGSESIVSVGGGYPGSTYFVAETGLDTNDGEDESTAFATIAKALTVATTGDTVEIASGTFTEVFPLTVPQGVTVRGKGLRSTTVQPTSGTERNDAFLLNGECAVQELSITNFYYDSSADTGYGFKFAPNMVTTTRSPYVQRVSVITRGSDTSASDPYGFDTADNYPTSKVAGRGCLIDGSVVSSATLEPAILFNEVTFITPNQTGLKMTNGARAEWVNCFTYFASVSIDGSSGSVGVGSTANATLKLDGVTTSIVPDQVIKYYQGGPAVAIGTVTSVDGAYVTISGKGDGIFNAVGVGSTQDVRIFASDGVTQVGTASTILWADYQKFGADLRAIGAASNFGTLGVRGDGAGVQLRLFGYNFGCVGSGKTFTQDPTLTIRSNEAIQLNGGRVFFQSVDQEGNFRVGSIFEISQETGAVSLASTSDINIAGTATITNLNVSGFSTFQGQILHQDPNFVTDETTYNLINTNAGAVNFAGAGTSIVIGATTGITTIRNYEVNLSGGQESYTSTTGTLTVDGGVGISSNLNVGKDLKVTGVSTFVSSTRLDADLRVAGVSTFVDDVMLSSDLDVAGITTTSTLRVTGISTLSGDVRLDNNIRVAGVSTFVGDTTLDNNLRVAGVSTLVGDVELDNNLQVTGITTFVGISTYQNDLYIGNDLYVLGDTRIVGVLTVGSSSITLDGSENQINIGTGVTAHTDRVTVTQFRASGVSTFGSDVDIEANFTVAGLSTFTGSINVEDELDVTNSSRIGGDLRVVGISTLVGDTTLDNNLRVAGVSTLVGDVELSNNLQVTGVTTFVGVSTYQNDLYVGNDIYVGGDARIVGVLTVGSSSITIDGSNNQINIGTGVTAHTDQVTVTQFRASGVSTFGSDVDIEANFTVGGASTFTGAITYSEATGTTLNNTGTAELNNVNVSGILTAPFINSDTGADFAQLRVTGVTTLSDFTINSGLITGPSQITIDPAGVGDNTGSVRIKGDLYVDGTQTTVNSTVVEIGDKLVGLGTTAIEIVVLKNNGTVAIADSIITGISTDQLAIGYGVSTNSTTGAGATIVSIGSSAVTLNLGVDADTDILLDSVVIGIGSLGNGVTFINVGVGSTAGINVGAALSSASFAANTRITEIGIGTIYFTPETTNVGVSTENVTVTDNGIFYFTDLLSGDFVADGGGISLYGKTNKTLTWDLTNDSWTSSENFNLDSGKAYKINGVTLLNSSRLTVSEVVVTDGTITNLTSTDANVTRLNATESLSTPNLNATGISTIVDLKATDVNVSSAATITNLTATDSTLETINVNTGFVTTISGTDINYTGIATFGTLIAGQVELNEISSLQVAGVSTFLDNVNVGLGTTSEVLFTVAGVSTFIQDSTFDSNIIVSGITTVAEFSATTGIITNFTANSINIYDVAGTATTIGTGITCIISEEGDTSLTGIDTTGLQIGDSITGNTYIQPSTTIIGIGTDSIIINPATGTISTNVGVATQVSATFDSAFNNVNGFVDIIGIDTTGLQTFDLVVEDGLYIQPNTFITNIGVGSITISPESLANTGIDTQPIDFQRTQTDTGVGTTSITVERLVGQALGVATIPTLNAQRLNVTGFGTFASLQVSSLSVNSSQTDTDDIQNLYFVSGIGTRLDVSSGIITEFYNAGVGTIATLYNNSGVTTHSSITDLNVTGIATFTEISSVYSSGTTGVSTVEHLTGTDLNYSGISTFNSGIATHFNIEDLTITGVTTTVSIYTTDFSASGLSTITHLEGDSFNFTGLSTATNFISSDVRVSGAASISTLNADVGIITNSVWTDGYSSGITSLATLNVNSGVVTSLNVTEDGTVGYFFGTNFYISGIGSANRFDINVGTSTHFTTNDFEATGFSTVVSFKATDAEVTGVTTIGTKLIVPDTEISHIAGGVNLAFSGIGTIDTLRTNVGFVTSLSGTNLYYPGIGTIGWVDAENIDVAGIATIPTIYNTYIDVSGVTTSARFIGTDTEFEHSELVDINVSSAATIARLSVTDGTITNLSGTIGTITRIQNVDLNTTGVATITHIEGTSSNITGVSTFGDLFATTIKTDALDLTGAAINFTGIATFRILSTDDATIGSARAASLDVAGISTLPRIYNVDIQSTGFTTSYKGIHVGAGGTIITADATSGIGSVGINTSVPRNALHVYGNIQQDGSTLVGTISTERSTGTAVKVHTELGRFDYRSVEYTVQVSYGVTHQVAKIMSVHDGVTAYNSEYANISTGIDIATFDVQIDNTVPPGNIALVVTPIYGASGITTIVANFQATRLTSL